MTPNADEPPRIDLTMYVDEHQEFVCEAVTDPAVLASLKRPRQANGAPEGAPLAPPAPNTVSPESHPNA